MSNAAKARLLSKAVWAGECLVWTGGMGSGGYGTFHFNGRNQSAHRVSYLIHKGEIPEGMVVMHSCDNRRCINPAHLSIGTSKGNAADMNQKGRNRQVAGTKHHAAKLTPEIAAEIRRRYRPYCRKDGSSALAREFGITQGAVHAVIRGVTWRE